MAFPSTFLDIRNEVIDKLRLDATLDLQKTKDWVNAAYAEACIETEFYATSSTSAALTLNQGSVPVPTGLQKLDYITSVGTDGTIWGPMKMVTFDEILRNRAYASGAASTTGAPYLYAFRSSNAPSIEIWPPAAGGEVLTFYGQLLPTVLVNDGDVPIIPEPYGSNCLIFGAAAQAAEFKQNYLMMGQYAQEQDLWIARLRGFNNTRVGDDVQQFQVVGYRQAIPPTNSVDVPYNW